VKTCAADGSGYGTCANEVKPNPLDMCGDGLDDNCDGTPDDLCVCNPGTMASCYDGKPGTSGKGICHDGTKTCNATGTGYTACMNEQIPLVEDCNVKGDEDCDGIGCSDAIWADVFTINDCCDALSGPALTVDASGRVYFIESGSGMFTLNNGLSGYSTQVFGALNTSGVAQWAKTTGTGVGQLAHDAAGTVYSATGIVGMSGSALAAYNSAGTVQWSKALPAHVSALAVANMNGNNWLFAAGEFSGSVKFGNLPTITAKGLSDVWVGIFSKVDGSPLTVTSFGGVGGNATSAAIVADGVDNVTMFGTFDKTITIAGVPYLTTGLQDLFAVHMNSVGGTLSVQWSKAWGSVGNDTMESAALDSLGNPIFVGSHAATINLGGANLAGAAYVAKIAAATGAHSWSSDMGCWPANPAKIVKGIHGVAVDSADNVAVAGVSGGACNAPGNMQNMLVKMTSAGVPLWSKTLAQSCNAGPVVAIGPADKVIFTGCTFDSTVDLGLGAMAVGAGTGILFAEYQP
jgi:hypothetical protein